MDLGSFERTATRFMLKILKMIDACISKVYHILFPASVYTLCSYVKSEKKLAQDLGLDEFFSIKLLWKEIINMLL